MKANGDLTNTKMMGNETVWVALDLCHEYKMSELTEHAAQALVQTGHMTRQWQGDEWGGG